VIRQGQLSNDMLNLPKRNDDEAEDEEEGATAGLCVWRNETGRSSLNREQVANALNSYRNHMKPNLGHRKSKVLKIFVSENFKLHSYFLF
jgi:hypothetical protein